MNKKITCKQDGQQLNIGDVVGGEIAVNGIILARDLPMNGFYVSVDLYKASLELWQNAPIVAPTHVEATQETTFGVINRAYAEGGKLKADATIYAGRLKMAYPVLHDRITTGQPVSGSIQIEIDGFITESNYKSRPVQIVATKITNVNHYALLQDEMGACDVIDGCGVNLTAKKQKEVKMTEEQVKALFDGLETKLLTAVNDANQQRSEKLEVNHIKPCEFNKLVERVTATEEMAAKLEASYTELNDNHAVVTEENTKLKEQVKTLTASLAQVKNNATGVNLTASGESEDQPVKYLL